MPRKPNPKPDNAEQSARFIEAAKQFQKDQDLFVQSVDGVIKSPPIPVETVRKKTGQKKK